MSDEVSAGQQTAELRLPGLPFGLTASDVSSWPIEDATVSTTARPRSDLFVDPARRDPSMTNPVTLLGTPPAGDFQLSARVAVDFAGTFDAGVLLLYADDANWAKLCFEFSPQGQPMVVSVVCRGVADDANAFDVDGRSVWLRISRTGPAFAFHASTDGHTWQFVRYFALDVDMERVQLGFEAQSPTGDGCQVSFDSITFHPTAPSDLRNGV